MEAVFYKENRKALYDSLENHSVLLSFAGNAPHQTADAYYPFFANRNFVYLTGLDGVEPCGCILMAVKLEGKVEETIFTLPPDALAERWSGRRLKAQEITERSGVEQVAMLEQFPAAFHRLASLGLAKQVKLDLWKHKPEQPDDEAHRFAGQIKNTYPAISVDSYHMQLRRQRTIKKPCEIAAMKTAMTVTKAGIEAMMSAAKPGIFEYELKAEFDRALTGRGVMTPAFSSIISTGKNNFCIHYNQYNGQSRDGDMILNDVGAWWDGICTDVSRGWPVNGRFDERQRALYTCAYETSEYMFQTIRPGIPMNTIDKLCHKFCCEKLIKLGLLESFDEIGKYMWHGGAHHVGFDVHDQVYVPGNIEAGMVFCVDVGIYVEEWGIGFRLEDNCLVTEDGCVNLSADIPRSIEEIEAFMEASR